MRVIEIFQSIDGEVNAWGQGFQSTFVRFAGCNLNCGYCDTPQSRELERGLPMSPDDIMTHIHTQKVTLTGGEPLLQKQEEMEMLLDKLINHYKLVTIETNGTVSVDPYKKYGLQVCFVVDYKLDIPKDLIKVNIKNLTHKDVVKFPILSKADYEKATDLIPDIIDGSHCMIAFSPIGMSAQILLDWLQKDGLDFVILNVQLHKLLGLR